MEQIKQIINEYNQTLSNFNEKVEALKRQLEQAITDEIKHKYNVTVGSILECYGQKVVFKRIEVTGFVDGLECNAIVQNLNKNGKPSKKESTKAIVCLDLDEGEGVSMEGLCSDLAELGIY